MTFCEIKIYKPYDNKEKEDVQKVKYFLENYTNCYDRSNLEGYITAGAFVGDKQGNILLNHHKKSGLWFQFGGHSDGEEDSLNVAKREIMEETGLEITNIKQLKTYEIINAPNEHRIIIY